jgi:hypothetical protein
MLCDGVGARLPHGGPDVVEQLSRPEHFEARHLELEHRRGDLTGGRIGDRRRGPFEYEQSCTGDLARERFAVADREERVPSAVHHERRDRELGQALASARLAVELGEHHAHLVGHLDRGLRARRAVPDALGGRARGGGVVAEDSAPPAANSATAARSDQSGIERENSLSIVAASGSGRSSSTGPGATGRVPASVSAENASGWSSAATWATTPPTPMPARCAGRSSSPRASAAASAARSRSVYPEPWDRRWPTRRNRAGRTARRGARRARAPRTARQAKRAWSCRPRAERVAPPRRRSARPRA